MPEWFQPDNWHALGHSDVRKKIATSAAAPCPVCGSVNDSCGWIVWDIWPIDDDYWLPKKFPLKGPPDLIEAFYSIACRKRLRRAKDAVAIFFAKDLDALVP